MQKVIQCILRAIPISLQTLAEQHRIAGKVEFLIALCDRLEAALTTADTTRARLLEALLHEALDSSAPAAPGSCAETAMEVAEGFSNPLHGLTRRPGR